MTDKTTSQPSHLITQPRPRGAGSAIPIQILNEVLALPPYVSELNSLLSRVPVDLKRVGKIIRGHPALSDHLIHLCRLRFAGFDVQNASIEQGIVFLGTEQMRTLILVCCVILEIGGSLASNQLRSFWQHGLLTASLGKRIAGYIGYPRPETASRAGLVHDVGVLALARFAGGTQGQAELANGLCGEVVEEECSRFGTDHCLVGSLIGRVWGLPDEIVDVLEFHHNPEGAKHDRLLAGIVAAADNFCVVRGPRLQSVKELASVPQEGSFQRALCRWLPALGNNLARHLEDALAITYLRKINKLKGNDGGVFCGFGL